MQLFQLQEKPVLAGYRQAWRIPPVVGQKRSDRLSFHEEEPALLLQALRRRAFGVGNDTPVGRMCGINTGCL